MSKVTIYSTPTCVYCKMAKEFFAQNDIQYEDKNVATDVDARNQMVKKSGQMGVPVIDIDGKIIVGFNRPEIETALGIK